MLVNSEKAAMHLNIIVSLKTERQFKSIKEKNNRASGIKLYMKKQTKL